MGVCHQLPALPDRLLQESPRRRWGDPFGGSEAGGKRRGVSGRPGELPPSEAGDGKALSISRAEPNMVLGSVGNKRRSHRCRTQRHITDEREGRPGTTVCGPHRPRGWPAHPGVQKFHICPCGAHMCFFLDVWAQSKGGDGGGGEASVSL